MVHQYIQPIKKMMKANADQEKAKWARAYLLNQFEFYGLPTALRRSVCKDYMRQNLPPYNDLDQIVKDLFGLPQREFHHFAIELISAFRKQWDKKIIELIEYTITIKSWWDTVDYISAELSGPYFKKFPGKMKQITGNWNRSDNFWLQRSSLLFQKNYKQETDTKLLATFILHLSESEEFFIQKAIGWVLREYARTDPSWVKDFIQKNKLPSLSKREALKRL